MNRWEHYHVATDVNDALRVLANTAGPVSVIGGGTDLLLDIEQGRHEPAHTLVDVTRVLEMCAIELRAGTLFVGAGAALSRVVGWPPGGAHAQALQEAANLIGGPQVRNTATLGGNVAHALPAADGTIALVALDAQAEIASPGGRRLAPIESLFRGPGKSTLDPARELLVGFHLPLRQPGEASAFRRVMRPQGVAIAILNLGGWLQRQGDTIAAIRISAGPSGPVPQRLRGAETSLVWRTPDQDGVEAAVDALLGEARFRTSPHRASAEYRRHLAGVLLSETLISAWERAAR